MIDSLVNLLFRCPHKRLTRPVTPVCREAKPQAETYVVCLDCGKQFSYDLRKMRVGKPLPVSADYGVLPAGMPPLGRPKWRLAMIASAVPVGIVLASVLSSKHRRAGPSPESKVEEASTPHPEPPGPIA